MTRISFTIPGSPVGKGRPRVSVRGGYAHAYTPEKTRTYEARVRGYKWGWDYELNHYHCGYAAIEEMIKRAELKALDALREMGR